MATNDNMDAEADRIARDLKIPPCPAVLADYAAEAKKDDPDPRKLANLIGKDAALASAIIRAVNSPLYGLGRQATDIQQALAILGLRAAGNLITGLLLRQAFPAASGAMMQRFWDDSSQTSEAAGELARHLKGVSRDEVLTFGLFRNSGMAVMIAKFPDYGSIVEAHATGAGAELMLAEEARYRYNHARVGYSLARGWLLSDTMSKSILFHHDIAQVAARTRETELASPALTAAGLLAEQIKELRAGRGLTPEWLAHEAFCLETLAIDADTIAAIVSSPGPA